MTWLAASMLGLPRYLWIIAAVAVLVVGFVLWMDGERDDAFEAGAAVQREGDLRTTIERTEKGNAAREAIQQPGATGDALRYEQCLRTARTPANCQRFLPQRPAD